MSIAHDISRLEVSSRIELFELDTTVVGGDVYYFVNESNELSQPVVWQGVEYNPFPIEASGFETRHDGPLPRPTLKVASGFGLIGALVRQYRRLELCKLVRRQTLVKYLDAVNFEGGVNDDADPTSHWPDDTWYIDRLASRNKHGVMWELASPLDLPGVQLPARQVIAGACGWAYRSSECGYAGGPVAKADDTATSNPALDACGKRLASCVLRFGVGAELPFGGFPGCGVIRNV